MQSPHSSKIGKNRYLGDRKWETEAYPQSRDEPLYRSSGLNAPWRSRSSFAKNSLRARANHFGDERSKELIIISSFSSSEVVHHTLVCKPIVTAQVLSLVALVICRMLFTSQREVASSMPTFSIET